jgi:hypothetical protein
MNSFQSARTVEYRGMLVLTPFLQRRAHNGQFVLLSKGALAKKLQETIGDAVLNTDAATFYSVEIKCEESNDYGNFFVETWSNRNLEHRASHAERGSNPGWLVKLKCDLLLYYFLAQDELYVIDFFKLKRWAFGHAGQPPRIYSYPEKPQGKRAQLNDTFGRCVPISIIQKEVGYRLLYPKQIPFWEEMDGVA